MANDNTNNNSWMLFCTPLTSIRYFRIMPTQLKKRPSFLVLPNTSQSELYLADWCKETFDHFVLQEFCCTMQTIPAEYLPHPLYEGGRPIPYHDVTPLPEEFRAGILELAVITKTHRVQNACESLPLFSLPKSLLQKRLSHKICQQTRLVIDHSATIDQDVHDLPVYEVVGSLGLFKNSVQRELLLLRTDNFDKEHPFHFVELIVHPTHVSVDVGFLQTLDIRWERKISRTAKFWGFVTRSRDNRKYREMLELLYVRAVISLRKQRQS